MSRFPKVRQATLNRRSVYVFDAQKASEYCRENNIKSHRIKLWPRAHTTNNHINNKTISNRYVALI